MPSYERDYYREESRGGGFLAGRFSKYSAVTWLIVINFVVWFWDTIFGQSARADWLALGQHFYFSFDKAVSGLQIWRWFTFQFIHGDFFHLVFNLIGLFFFGPLMEQWWGTRRFIVFYLLCGVSGAATYLLLAFVPGLLPFGTGAALIGASGGVFGILVGCAVLYPHQRVMLLFPPIPMSMRTLALIFLAIAALKVIVGHMNAGGEAAHLGGALLGFVLVKNGRWLDWADRIRSPGPTIRQAKVQRDRNQARNEQAEVDRILDKVRDRGLQSLSRKEKNILSRATERSRRAG